MRFIYNYTGSVNGVDAQGHYIRSAVDATDCVARSAPTATCPSTFEKKGAGGDDATAAKATVAKTKAASTLLDYLLGQDGGK